MLKCAPISNQNDPVEVAGFLAAGDPENKPSQLLAMPAIPQQDIAQLMVAKRLLRAIIFIRIHFD